MHRSDTSEEAQKIYDQKIRELTEEERFLKGISLTHFCRQVCFASILESHPGLSSQEMKIQLFERIYGPLFLEPEKEKIRAFLKAH